MEKYIAKSNGETLIQHTNNLTKQFLLLKNTYPNIFNSQNWQLLLLACNYHDLGKINNRFQSKILVNKNHDPLEIPHGLLSIAMIPIRQLEKQYGFNRNQLKVLINAIAWHHERDFSKITEQHYRDEITKMIPNATSFINTEAKNLEIDLPLQKPAMTSKRYYSLGHRLPLGKSGGWNGQQDNQKLIQLFVKVKGLLNRLDYAASGHYPVEATPRVNLSQNVLTNWQKNDPQANWNDLQNWTYEHQKQNIVVIAQTGEGKTESALRWLGNSKAFYVLPLKSAINAIYDRIAKIVFESQTKQINNSLALLHSDMVGYLLEDSNKVNYQQLKQLVNENRQWSKQLSIATLDQVFPFVFHYKNYEAKLVTLAYSKVVIDEIQMYTPDLLAYIIYGLKQIQDYGGHFEIMTATLAPFVLDLMKSNELSFVQPSNAFLDDKINQRHRVKVVHNELTSDAIAKLDRHGKTLVVCNTIKKAIELYTELNEKGFNVHLIHSRFTRHDRKLKEKAIERFGKINNSETGIWIGTQVVEASLDIDFDLLITELSELNGLFQRMGRCYRKRNYNDKLANVYIYDGGEKATSGINRSETSVVDWTMFNISKQAIRNIDGYLPEQAKLDLINNNYISTNLGNFVSQVQKNIAFLKATENDHPDKAKIQRIFRNIQNIDVIPENIYLQNKKQIDADLSIITQKDLINPKEKLQAKEDLKNWLVSVPSYIGNDKTNFVENKSLNKIGYLLLSKKYNYSSNTGLSLTK